MKLPADLNPRVDVRVLEHGTPVWDVTLTFNEEDHVYTVTELTEFSSVQILLKAIADGYGQVWEPIEIPTTPIFEKEIEIPKVPAIPVEPTEVQKASINKTK